MKKLSIMNMVWKEGDFYISKSLLNNVSSFGNTKKEAVKNLSEALDLYYEDAKEEVSFIKAAKPEIYSSEIMYA